MHRDTMVYNKHKTLYKGVINMKKSKIIGVLMALSMVVSTATGIPNNSLCKQLNNPVTVSAANNVVLGWHSDSIGYWYVIKRDGTYVKDAWRIIDGKRYLFGKDGYMLTGWQERNGRWYYLHYSTGEMWTGWLQDGADWYYLETLKSGSPFSYGGMLENCLFHEKGKVYYFGKDGKMARNGWVGKTHYAYSDGHLAVGRVIINGKRCEFDRDGYFIRYW